MTAPRKKTKNIFIHELRRIKTQFTLHIRVVGMDCLGNR